MKFSQRTTEVGPLSFRAELGTADAEQRLVDATWSAGSPVLRRDWTTGKPYLEVLSMDPKHVDLSRLNRGASVLDSHSAWSVSDILGAVVDDTARIEKGLGVATLRFSDRDAVTPVWGDIKRKIVRHVSVGYLVRTYLETQAPGDQYPTRTAIDWTPYELSMVAIPADAEAGTRSQDNHAAVYPCVVVTRGSNDADRMRRFRLALARAAS